MCYFRDENNPTFWLHIFSYTIIHEMGTFMYIFFLELGMYIKYIPASVSIDTYNYSKTQPYRTTCPKETKSSSKKRETKTCLNTGNPITK